MAKLWHSDTLQQLQQVWKAGRRRRRGRGAERVGGEEEGVEGRRRRGGNEKRKGGEERRTKEMEMANDEAGDIYREE